MPDVNYEEHCPCGNTIKVSGSTVGGVVTGEISRWHRVHDKHATEISKSLVESIKSPPCYIVSDPSPEMNLPLWNPVTKRLKDLTPQPMRAETSG